MKTRGKAKYDLSRLQCSWGTTKYLTRVLHCLRRDLSSCTESSWARVTPIPSEGAIVDVLLPLEAIPLQMSACRSQAEHTVAARSKFRTFWTAFTPIFCR